MRISPDPFTPFRVLVITVCVALLALTGGQIWSYQQPVAPYHDANAYPQSVAPDKYNKNKKRLNPWRGLTGCLSMRGPDGTYAYLHENVGSAFSCASFCGSKQGLAAANGLFPEKTVRNRIQPWLASPQTANPDFVDLAKTNVAWLPGRGPVSAGGDVRLTLNPMDQQRAATLLACMTGSRSDCASSGIDISRWNHMVEGAAARSIAFVQIDVTTGEIEVLASAGSPRFLADAEGKTPEPTDPIFTHARKPRKNWLDNLVLYQEAPLGSVNKPWLALALIRAGVPHFNLKSNADRQWLAHTLRTSDTPALLDRVVCKKQGFPETCGPISHLGAAAADLGWNAQARDLFLGGHTGLMPLSTGHIYMQKKQSGWESIPTLPLNPEKMASCAQRKWSQCRGEYEAKLVAELFGAGSSQATPLAVASAYARLGAAANGRKEFPSVHLVREVRMGENHLVPAPPEPLFIDPAHAREILNGLSQTHKAGTYQEKFWAGTAFSACTAAFDAKTCNRLNSLAIKTGTPSFSHDRWTWKERLSLCEKNEAQLQAAQAAGKPIPPALKRERDRCAAIPFKWAVAVVRRDNAAQGPYEKVIVVLVERNWQQDGYVDARAELKSNVAAEVIFRYLHDAMKIPNDGINMASLF